MTRPMDVHSQKDRNTLLKREDGVVTVEFIILFPLFMLIIVGIVEFGHLFYVRHTLTNASREGARAAVVYYTPAAGREAWAKDKAEKAVEKYLDNFIPGQYDKPPVVTFPNGSAATGNQLKVTVSASKNLLLLDKLVPAFQEITKIETATTMRME